MDTTLVLSGILPPIIRTSPNSPMVWANAKTAPVIKLFLISGICTNTNVSNGFLHINEDA